MPRKRFVANGMYPYHVSSRCINKEWFQLPMEDVWNIFGRYLHFISHAYCVTIHAFVLMNNHFHLLVTTPQSNLDQAMNYFLREVSRSIGIESGRINQVFGGPYFRSMISDSIHYQQAYKYVYRNPVEAGLCNFVEEYKYSSLAGLIGQVWLPFPAFDNQFLIQDTGRCLRWLNTPFPSENVKDQIRKALRREEFKFSRDPKTGEINPLNLYLI